MKISYLLLGYIMVELFSANVSTARERAIPLDAVSFPWLDRRIGRFYSPVIEGGACAESCVLAIVERIGARVSIETASQPRAGETELRFGVLDATPRKVFGEISKRRRGPSRLMVFSSGDVSCILEQELASDPDWPLNATNVPGIQIDGISFREAFEKAVETIRNTYNKRHPGGTPWDVMSTLGNARTWLSRSAGLELGQQVTGTLAGGSARSLLWQVAMLRPNCIWFARDSRGIEPNGEPSSYRYCELDLAACRSGKKKSTEGIVTLLLENAERNRGGGSSEFPQQYNDCPKCLEPDLLEELRTRGIEGVHTVIKAYRETEEVDSRFAILHCFAQLMVWPDCRSEILQFAKAELRRTTGPLETALDEFLNEAEVEQPAPGPDGRWGLWRVPPFAVYICLPVALSMAFGLLVLILRVRSRLKR